MRRNANTKGSANALHDLNADGTWKSTTWAAEGTVQQQARA
ncbi:MAG: hypothetical protein OER77_05125 [Myxococcales bacterium]|nr:hypothetical protein [Myxococcales bacterium]